MEGLLFSRLSVGSIEHCRTVDFVAGWGLQKGARTVLEKWFCTENVTEYFHIRNQNNCVNDCLI